MAVTSRGIRVGTRGSALAREQTQRVTRALEALDPTIELDVRIVRTAGDVDRRTPLAVLGGQGVFARELQAALLSGEVDLAVHSAKDLPSALPDELILAALVERDDPRDVLVSRDGRGLRDLPAGARVGTSSRRRVVQLRRARPDLEVVDLRGNIDTRLRRVQEGAVDAVLLAAAGLQRMGWEHRISEYLLPDAFVPAPGQGAVAVECRRDDGELIALLRRLNHAATRLAVSVERAFLAATGGGCQSPIGAYARLDGDTVVFQAMLGAEALTHAVAATRSWPAAEAVEQAGDLARALRRELGA